MSKSSQIAEVNLNALLAGMLGLAVAGIAGGYALSVQQSVKTSMACNNASVGYTYSAARNTCYNGSVDEVLSNEGNAVTNSMNGVANITAEFDLVGTIVVATVILGLIFGLFKFVRA